MIRFALLFALAACDHTPSALASTKPTPNHARAIAAVVETADIKCSPWTGRETLYAGVDSMLCVGAAQMIYVSAPDGSEPVVKVFLQSQIRKE